VSQLNNRKKTGAIASIIICCLLIAGTLLFLFYRQRITDQIIVWSYNPSADVISLVDRGGMNDNGKFYYLASQPELFLPAASTEFDQVCDQVESTTAILGCYNGFKIYIKDVVDEQLDGISEVTAVHETLHAIYDRMGDDEKAKIDVLLQAEYIKLKDDETFLDLMEFYSRSEPGQRNNELHSIIGAEVAVISPELETYYSKYFADRQKVVALNTKYSGVFDALKSRADELSAQLTALSETITNQSDQYNSDSKILNNDIISFNNRANSSGFSSQTQFNNDRNILINRSEALDATRNSINEQVDNYKTLAAEHDAITIESKTLYNLLDNPLAPAPSL
jgi:hypothetical protein